MRYLYLLLTLIVCLGWSQVASGQGGVGNTGGQVTGNTGANTQVPATDNLTGQPGQQQVGGAQRGGAAGDRNIGNDIANRANNFQLDVVEIEDLRQQEFVGQRSNNFFHHYSQFNENGLGAGANRQLGTGGAGGQRGGGVGFNQGANNLGFVFRRSIRSRLRPNFSAPTLTSSARSNQFNSRVQRSTTLREMAQGVNFVLEGKTGRLTGTVQSQQQKKMMERQARLEPGVFRVVNEIRVVGGQ